MKRSLRELMKLYEELDYIVYRNRYLIPQRPKRVILNNLFGHSKNYTDGVIKAFSSWTNLEFMDKIRDPRK
jgi:hypothetical protein